nr:hypothetical protein [Tanacetum cinerariifolium]
MRRRFLKAKSMELNLDEGNKFLFYTIILSPRYRQPKESNPSQPPAFTLVVARLHNEYHQAIGSPTSLGVTSEEGAYLKLNSVVSASITKPVYSTSTILHSESASGHDALAAFTAKADPGKTDQEDDDAKKDDAKKVQLEEPKETKYASSFHPLSPRSIKIQKLTNHILLLQSHNQKLKKLKTRVEAKVAFLNSIPAELKEIPSKFNDLTGDIRELKKCVEKLEVELPWDLIEIPTKLEQFTSTAKIKTLDALPSLLSKVAKALDGFAKSVEPASQKAGEFIKKDKGKKSMSSKDAKEEDTRSDSGKDANLTSSMVKSSKQKKLKKFDFVTEEELDIDFNKPLSEQDPILKLNDLAINKRMLMIFMTTSGRILSPLKTLDISQMKCCTLYKKSSSDFIFYLMKLIKGT